MTTMSMTKEHQSQGQRFSGAVHEMNLPGPAANTKTESDITTADQRIERLVAASPAVLYALSYRDGIVNASWVSANIQRFMGYTTQEVSFDWWRDNVHPDDVDEVLSRLAELPEADALLYEYRFRHKDGNYRWVRDEQRGILNADGDVVEIVGAWMDITDTKRLEQKVAEASAETIMLLASAAEAFDPVTGQHLDCVRTYSEALALELGYRARDAAELGLAAVLHDVGKLRVPQSILTKPASLTDFEWDVMRLHTTWGRDFLAVKSGLELASTIAWCHHERWDGTGYPNHLAAEAIPDAASIVAVADAYDAMTSERPYCQARRSGEAIAELIACSGTQFSPRVVDALVSLDARAALPASAAE